MKPAIWTTQAAVVLAGAAVMLAGPVSGHAASPTARPDATTPPVPDRLKVPAGNEPVAFLAAKGVQTYACTKGSWTLLEPAATLWKSDDSRHTPVAIHTRGPVWVSTIDGSAVNAAVVASAPHKDAVPELLLKATANRGDGLFGKVSYVQRLSTSGGRAPTTACTGTSQTSIPYSALYVFYTPHR
ncbi:DUF3455 domain-containing protein [Streptomyces sp. NPDC047079]|uniref:DUF3455 domain-containing protein n=1 Tax=Streptomyces sp. NPDC047079 TaxID=3154607 RepID=UPI0033D32A80